MLLRVLETHISCWLAVLTPLTANCHRTLQFEPCRRVWRNKTPNTERQKRPAWPELHIQPGLARDTRKQEKEKETTNTEMKRATARWLGCLKSTIRLPQCWLVLLLLLPCEAGKGMFKYHVWPQTGSGLTSTLHHHIHDSILSPRQKNLVQIIFQHGHSLSAFPSSEPPSEESEDACAEEPRETSLLLLPPLQSPGLKTPQ